MAELNFIHWLRGHTARHPYQTVPLGDDCASFQWPETKQLLVTTDMLLEGSCFLRDAGPERIGRKAMSVNFSDIAAMAGKPVAAFVSLGLPDDLGESWARQLFLSMQTQAARFETFIAGGDTNAWKGLIAINITLIGEHTSQAPVTRSGAKPGDALMVTGCLGGSINGHHLDFTPRIKEAQLLHTCANLHAMIDVSDGLATDLHHLCRESNCGAELWANQIPVSAVAMSMNDGKTPLQHALGDGEDFELLFAVSQDDSEKLLKDQPLDRFGVNLTCIGKFLPGKAVILERDGQRVPLAPFGYEHRF